MTMWSFRKLPPFLIPSRSLAGPPIIGGPVDPCSILFTLDIYAGAYPNVVTIDTTDGSVIDTTALTNAGGLIAHDFVRLTDGSILAFDFPLVPNSFDADTSIVVRHIEVDGTTASVDTGYDAKPRRALGGYQRGSSVFMALSAHPSLTKHVLKLDSAFGLVSSLVISDATTLSHFVRGPSGYGLITLVGGQQLHRINESTMLVDASLDVDAYLNGEGYDGPWNGTAAIAVLGGTAILDHSTIDTVSGDVRRVLVAVDVATMTVVDYSEFDAPTFGQELGGSSMLARSGVITLAAARPHLSRWEVRRFDAVTLAETDLDTTAWPTGVGNASPWGSAAVRTDGRAFFGLDAFSTEPISNAASFVPASGVVSFSTLGVTSVDAFGEYGGLSPVAIGCPDPGFTIVAYDSYSSTERLRGFNGETGAQEYDSDILDAFPPVVALVSHPLGFIVANRRQSPPPQYMGLTAFAADLTQLWQYQDALITVSGQNSKLAVGPDGTTYYALHISTTSVRVIAVDETGSLVWAVTHATSAPSSFLYYGVTTVVGDGVLWVVTAGRVHALDISDGSEIHNVIDPDGLRLTGAALTSDGRLWTIQQGDYLGVRAHTLAGGVITADTRFMIDEAVFLGGSALVSDGSTLYWGAQPWDNDGWAIGRFETIGMTEAWRRVEENGVFGVLFMVLSAESVIASYEHFVAGIPRVVSLDRATGVSTSGFSAPTSSLAYSAIAIVGGD